SLEPVSQTIDEPIFARYAPAGRSAAGAAAEAGEGIDEPRELMSGPDLDLGAIAAEHFVLAIDPYPRAPGAELPDGQVGQVAPDSPFAKLAALRARLPDRG